MEQFSFDRRDQKTSAQRNGDALDRVETFEPSEGNADLHWGRRYVQPPLLQAPLDIETPPLSAAAHDVLG